MLLRSCLTIALLYLGVPGCSYSSEFAVFAQHLIAGAGGLLLFAGLWTPVVGTLVACDQMWIAFLLCPRGHEEMWTRVFLAMLAVSVAMLGPGAWSVDSRLFGRRRFDINRSRCRKPSL